MRGFPAGYHYLCFYFATGLVKLLYLMIYSGTAFEFSVKSLRYFFSSVQMPVLEEV